MHWSRCALVGGRGSQRYSRPCKSAGFPSGGQLTDIGYWEAGSWVPLPWEPRPWQGFRAAPDIFPPALPKGPTKKPLLGRGKTGDNARRRHEMFDLIVIGGGPAGATAVVRARELGATVALFEREHLGGTCTNDGCVPTRVHGKAARLVCDWGAV